MSLTTSEEKRLSEAESTVNQLAKLVQGAGSKNQLNRLLVLCQQEVGELKSMVDELEDKVDELIDLTRKLQ